MPGQGRHEHDLARGVAELPKRVRVEGRVDLDHPRASKLGRIREMQRRFFTVDEIRDAACAGPRVPSPELILEHLRLEGDLVLISSY